MEKETIINQLKKRGSKNTKTRNVLLEVLKVNHLPLTESELRTKLSKKGVRVNKTTVYRELSQLNKYNFVTEVSFGDGKKRFELNKGDHHHHLICTSCSKVDEVQVKDDINSLEQEISRSKNFKIINHSLEFFGLCKNCK